MYEREEIARKLLSLLIVIIHHISNFVHYFMSICHSFLTLLSYANTTSTDKMSHQSMGMFLEFICRSACRTGIPLQVFAIRRPAIGTILFIMV